MRTTLSRSSTLARLASFVVAILAAALPAQETTQPRRAPTPVVRIELPATNELLRLGSDAVPLLVAALHDPRPAVVERAVVVLGYLGPAAADALPRLAELARQPGALQTCATWAAHRVRVHGITLVADSGTNRILELDDRGQIVHEATGQPTVWDVELLPNGNYLVAVPGGGGAGVREITRDGKIVWQFDGTREAYDADRLPNGNTLITDVTNHRVIEVDRSGAIVWEFNKDIEPSDADRLADGNTLIADNRFGRVLEIDPVGNTVWTLEGLSRPVDDADRLPNGNTLICTNGNNVVREVDRRGAVVMEITGLNRPNDVDRLANGHTLVASYGGVIEFDAKGVEVWRLDLQCAGEANRY